MAQGKEVARILKGRAVMFLTFVPDLRHITWIGFWVPGFGFFQGLSVGRSV